MIKHKHFQRIISIRKRKTRIILFLKISLLILITSSYCLYNQLKWDSGRLVVDDGNLNELKNNRYHRNRVLLNVINEYENNSELLAAPGATPKSNGLFSNQTNEEQNCTPAAIFEFPPDGFTRDQRQHGWILLHLVIACYCFWLLALVCDDYFVPSIETLCLKLKMTRDVAGATFMAVATSSSELFINCVGTFITQGDLGVGTIVGSAVFNILAVPACCGLLTGQIIDLDWWPVSRDSLMYALSVIALIFTLRDGKVMWYEALGLVCAYIIYIFAMCFNNTLSSNAKSILSKCHRKKLRPKPFKEVTEICPLLTKKGVMDFKETEIVDIKNQEDLSDDESVIDYAASPWEMEDGTHLLIYIIKWPITLLLWLTIPDCRKHPRLSLLTLFVCVILIGLTSYLVAFLITVIGDTLSIPDSVMGLTFLAAGTSVPEAVSSVIVTNQGEGGMGISNSIGSNTFDILLCLGLPWLVKTLAFPTVPGNHSITLNSQGLTYSSISLLSTLVGLYVSFMLNKFRLDWKIGLVCTVMYIAFLILASLIELNYFFPVNLPTCDH